MVKIFIKSLFFIIIFILTGAERSFGQTITIGNVDPGPYAAGSSIAVPISVSGSCVNTNTTYNLYLSNASGSFAAQKLIGTFSNFYATFVNGVIPAGTPAGAAYAVRVVAVNPAITSTASPPFTIIAGTGVTAAVSSQLINPSYPEVFGSCSGKNNTSYSFVDQSTAGAAVTASFFNELSQTPAGVITPTAAGTPFTAAAAQYTIMVKAVVAGVVGTKAYFLINNTVNTSFGVTGSNTVCLGNGGTLTYNVDITSSSGIQNNFPGLIYNIQWGDGTKSQLTLCNIEASGGQISHTYTRTSCGNNPHNVHNSFEVDLQPADIYCGNTGTLVTSYAQVITQPVNLFNAPVAACANTAVTIINASDPGQDPNNTAVGCRDYNALYTWTIDGATVASNYPVNKNLVYTFTTAGNHTIVLHLQNANSLCATVDYSASICVQNPPQPKFTLPVTSGCVPTTIIPVNQSVTDANCNATNTYVWTVTGGAVSYAGGTNASSPQPQFVFNNAGVYSVQLGITTASCGTVTTPAQTVIINSVPQATLSPDATFCGTNQTFNFSPAAGPTQTFLAGSAQNVPGTYTWTITGGNYTYTNGTGNTSKYPQVNFTDFAAYTITVVNNSGCAAPATATQHLTFIQAPTVSAGANTSLCANGQVTLKGTVSGTVNSVLWTGGSGTYTPGPNVLNPSYTPSAAEAAAGSAVLTLTATTSLPAPCNSIASSVTLTITKPDAITSPAMINTCSGVPLNYQITAAVANSTFTWTVDQTQTSASVAGYANSGSGTIINDILVNNDPVNYATITYDIVATGGSGCSGNQFVLTVVIAPKTAAAGFTQSSASGCGALAVQFTNTSVPANSTYTWDFGDGSPTTNIVNPSHTFQPRADGKDMVYTVTLTASSKCGNTQSFSSSVTVRPQVPVAVISPKQISGCSPFTLTVDNFSPGTNQSYTYFLYNGATLVQQITTANKNEVTFTPINVTATRQYTLYMVATGFCGTTGESNIIPITISAATVTAQMFLENGTNKGCAPFTTTFINNSVGADTYFYNIYDASNNVIDRRQGGTAPLPYVFGTPGTYYVTVTAENNCSTVESAPPIRVDVYAVPKPQFTADNTTGCKNVVVTFSNLTPGDVNIEAQSLLYDWDFGDGSPHSAAFSPPPHNYNYLNSPFTVTLTATNLATNCSAVIAKPAFINIIAPPATAFTEQPDSITSIPNYNFNFTDLTTGSPASFSWNFGDGKTSVSENPGHTYPDTGLYKVTLTTASQTGCDSTISHYVRITGVPGQLFLPNAFEPDGGTAELKTFMAKGSGIREWHMQIYNNFSQLVWETTKLDDKGAPVDGWDGTFKGTPAPQGVYIWQVSATFINGTEWKGNVLKNSLPKRAGTIHLIR